MVHRARHARAQSAERRTLNHSKNYYEALPRNEQFSLFTWHYIPNPNIPAAPKVYLFEL